MKFTQFMIKQDKGTNIVLLNTLNESVIEITKAEFDDVQNNLTTEGYNSSVFKVLCSCEFLIPDDVDEEKSFMHALENEWKTNTDFCVHILPTTACNFKCVYCYQSGIERQHSLDTPKSLKVVEYIKDYIQDKNIETATVVIHGGEPTMNWDVVPNILKNLHIIFKAKNINYRTQIVTNAYNLTIEKARLLSNYNWCRLQVTIDGPKHIHDKRRILLDNSGTYDVIIENIKKIKQENLIENISIRLNFDENNWEAILNYLPELKNLFGTKGITLSFGYVSDTLSSADAEKYIKVSKLKDSDIFVPYSKLYRRAIELGYNMQDLFMFDGMCTARMRNAMVISADGNIFKCLSGVGRQDFVVSNIYKREELPNYMFLDMYKECFSKKCPYIPLCNTGCRFNGYLKTNDIHSNDCKKDVLDTINPELLAIKYLRG